jgi:hypothetical protein
MERVTMKREDDDDDNLWLLDPREIDKTAVKMFEEEIRRVTREEMGRKDKDRSRVLENAKRRSDQERYVTYFSSKLVFYVG